MDVRFVTNPSAQPGAQPPLPIRNIAAEHGERQSGICTCDHPTMDPTPRAWTEDQMRPVKKTMTASAGIERARRGAKSRSTANAGLHAVVAREASMAVGMGGPRNAGLFAVQILSTGDPELRAAFHNFKKELVGKIETKNANFKASLSEPNG